MLAAPGGDGILLLHAGEMPVYYNGRLGPTQLAVIEENAARQLETWADELRAKVAVPVNTRLLYGSPGAAVIHVLDEDPTFDLVIVGSHGRSGLRRVLLGSVAEKVVRHAPCSVLVARWSVSWIAGSHVLP